METIDHDTQKTITELTQAKTIPSPQPSEGEARKDSAKWAAAKTRSEGLWVRMTDLYGHKFTSQFGKSPSDTWVRCVEGLTGDQIAKGLQRIVDNPTEWPPGAAEFRALCLGKHQTEAEREQAALEAQVARQAAETQRNRLRLRDENRRQRAKAMGDSTMANLYQKLGWGRNSDENPAREGSQE